MANYSPYNYQYHWRQAEALTINGFNPVSGEPSIPQFCKSTVLLAHATWLVTPLATLYPIFSGAMEVHTFAHQVYVLVNSL
jgi:hypothetical protein